MIRAVIVDDEAHARARLRRMLLEAGDVQIAAECANGRQAIETVARERPDLVFLDIQMPGMTGLEACRKLLQSDQSAPAIVFVTAYDAFAVKAFEVHALDYLLKPFEQERLNGTLHRVREQMRPMGTPQRAPDLAALLQELQSAARRPERLIYKEDGRVVFVPVESVDWIEADGNYVRVHAGSKTHYFRETLTRLEGHLPAGKFVRISRSVVVNLDRVQEMQPLFYGDYTLMLEDGTRLSLSRAYRERLEAALGRTS